MTDTWADWCIASDGITISGTRSHEKKRVALGDKWCFRCRTRGEFFDILMVPDGLSYYDPYWYRACGSCGATDGDLFPGWSRDYDC